MESTGKTHQTPQQPSPRRDLDTDLASSSHKATLPPRQGRSFLAQLGMVTDSDQGSRDIFKPTFSHHQQQDASTDTWICSLESAKGMNAAFYKCILSGQIDSLERMLEDEEDNLLDQVTPRQNTALHIVARQGLDQLIKPILSRRPALLTHQNANGDTALHLAAEAGHLALVESMGEFVRDVKWECLCEMMNNDGDTALHVAVRHRQTRVTIFLMRVHPKASYCLNKRGESPLFLTAELGELQIVKDMISMFDGNEAQSALEEGKSVIHAAILGGNPGVLESILSKYRSIFNSAVISMNGVSISPLAYAALKGNIQMVRYILIEFPDCAYKRERNGIFPIHIAVAEGHKIVLKEFLKFHPDSRELLTFEGHNILHTAVFCGKDDVVSYILSKPDFDELINVKDNQGNTPLHCVVAAKFPKVVDTLTWDKRVKLDLVNNDGQTPMDVAMNFENSTPSLKEQLTWMALRYAGALRRSFQHAKRSNELEQATSDTYKDRVNTLSVVATLVTTMSFAAGFTMPGGNNGSEPDLGMATFLKRRILQLFVISNSVKNVTDSIGLFIPLIRICKKAKRTPKIDYAVRVKTLRLRSLRGETLPDYALVKRYQMRLHKCLKTSKERKLEHNSRIKNMKDRIKNTAEKESSKE